MGNEPPKNNVNSVFQSSHPLFKNSNVVQIQGKRYIQSVQPSNIKDYDNWKNAIMDKNRPLNHEFLLLPQYTGFKEDGGLCASTGSATSVYPLYPYNLQQQINRRKPNKDYFKQSELYCLLYALITAKIDTKDYGYKVGDIKPSNIFMNQDRKIKVVNLLSSPLQTTNYNAALRNLPIASDSILAPQDMPLLLKGAKDNIQNTKSEVFAIGGTVMEAGLLTNFNGIYKNKVFDKNGLAELKDQWLSHQKYSQIFKGLVLNLVETDPSKRINIQSLYKFLSQYKQPINNRKSFIIEQAPVHFQQNVSFMRSKSQVRESGVKILDK